MIFFSKILKVSITDSHQEVIGKVKDVAVKHGGKEEYPIVTGIIFNSARGGVHFIDYKYIESLSTGEISLNNHHCWKSWDEDSEDIYLYRDLMDQQIFDVEGIRVVRVNDLQLVKSGGDYALVGIDISNKALLRRIGLLFYPLTKMLKANFIDWHSVNFIKTHLGSLKLNTPYKKLRELHPADLANLIENLTLHQSTKVVQSMDKEMAADVLAEVDPKYKDNLLEKISPQDLAKILEEMPTDNAADVLKDLSPHKRSLVFRRLGLRRAKVLNKLSDYGEGIAGSLMTIDFLAVKETYTVKRAIEEIRRKSDEHKSIYHVYVVDDDQHLKGIISIRKLILTNKKQLIKHCMADVAETIDVNTKDRDVARILTKYNLLSVAVVDEQNHLKGIVTVDDVMRVLLPKA